MLRIVRAPVWEPVFTAIDLKNTIIRIQDLDGANSIDVTIGEGDLNYTERRTLDYVLNLGVLDDVTLGDEVPMDVRLDFTWEYIEGRLALTVEDALKQRNLATGWTSVDTEDPCRPFAVDILIIYTPACGTADDETITLQDFRYEELDHQLKNKTVSVTGKCNVTEAAAVREAKV